MLKAHTSLFPQRSQSAFSFTMEDALKSGSAEAAPRSPKDRAQRLLEEAALPSWRSMDGLDGTSNAFLGGGGVCFCVLFYFDTIPHGAQAGPQLPV
jgi:hypothetical protein